MTPSELVTALQNEFGDVTHETGRAVTRPKEVAVRAYRVATVKRGANPKAPIRLTFDELDYPVRVWPSARLQGVDQEIPATHIEAGWVISAMHEWREHPSASKQYLSDWFLCEPVHLIARTAESAQIDSLKREAQMPDLSDYFKSDTFLDPAMLKGQLQTVVLTSRTEPYEFKNEGRANDKGQKLWVKTVSGHEIADPIKLTWKRFQTIATAYGTNTDNWEGKKIVIGPDEFQGHKYVEVIGVPPEEPKADDFSDGNDDDIPF